jgi:4-diphosphocytidyl-2-C-methyl-D-erythritol kinase
MKQHAERIARRAHAKINLGLRVCEKRTDGYHTIETVFHRIDLFDEIMLSPADRIEIYSSDPRLPIDDSNICHKAALLVQDHFNSANGVRCGITKNIPIGAGLGGGSSDGAVVLRALPELWNMRVDEETVRSLALILGSDVPFFLGDGSAAARGRGEILDYFFLEIPFVILLCHPNIEVSTAWAYARVVPRGPSQTDLRSQLLDGMKNPRLLHKSLANDFEDTVFTAYPAIADVKDSMLRDGAAFASMSGTGSSVYGFFNELPAAHKAAERFLTKGYRTYITSPHFRV